MNASRLPYRNEPSERYMNHEDERDHQEEATVRRAYEEECAQELLAEIGTPWHLCEVTYVSSCYISAHDLGLNKELPPGWLLHHVGQMGTVRWRVTFEVDGTPSLADGLVVRGILQKLGAFE